MSLVSIIVPAYNVEKYIKKCIDSLLRQSFTDFELLLIDDGSTDTTPQLCDAYAQQDERIKCFHKPNGGLSDARNYGLDRMVGEYVTFIDSDDYVSENYIECLFNMLSVNSDVQIAMLPIQMLGENDVPNNDLDENVQILSNVQAMKEMFLRKGISHTSCGKMFLADLWKSTRFPVDQNYEDYATSYYVFDHAKKVAYCNNRLYYYIQHRDSIMHQSCSHKTLSVLDVADSVTNYIESECPECMIEARALQTAVYLKNMQAILNTGIDQYPEYQTRIFAKVCENSKLLLKQKQVSKRDKIKILLLLFNKKLFLKIYNFNDGNVKV